jgi:hypothetical protein
LWKPGVSWSGCISDIGGDWQESRLDAAASLQVISYAWGEPAFR